MKKTAVYVFLTGILTAFSLKESTALIRTITLEELKAKTINSANDTLYVVNFWATWCKPCIEELPYFEQARKNNAGKKVKIFLISVDFMSEREKVSKFSEKKMFQNEVYLLNAGNPNSWINEIEKSWDGAIPATIMYKAGQKVFFKEGDLTQTELDSLIRSKNQ